MAKMKKKKGLSTAEIIQIEEAVKSGKGIGGLAVASKLLGKGIGSCSHHSICFWD